MADAYRNLTAPENTESGIADHALIAPFEAFADNGIKSPTAPFESPGDSVTIKTAHEFADATNGGFAKFNLAPEKNQYEAAPAGDKGFVKLTHTVTIFVPGSYASLHELMAMLLNKPHIVLVKDSNCAADMYYQIGNACNGAYASPNFKTSTSAEGVKGYEVAFEAKGGPVMLYKVTGGPKIMVDETP